MSLNKATSLQKTSPIPGIKWGQQFASTPVAA